MGTQFPTIKAQQKPKFPLPLDHNQCLFIAALRSWTSQFPKGGDVRYFAIKALNDGYEKDYISYFNQFPEHEYVKSNLGEIQRAIDSATFSLRNQMEKLPSTFDSYVYQPTSVTNTYKVVTGGMEQTLKSYGEFVKARDTWLKYQKEALNPKPTPSGEKDNPHPSEGGGIVSPYGDPVKEAQKWFEMMSEKKRQTPLNMLDWLEVTLSSSLQAVAKYGAIEPPTVESRYFEKYYQTVANLCRGIKPVMVDEYEGAAKKAEEERKSTAFWDSNKWDLCWRRSGDVRNRSLESYLRIFFF